MRMALCASCLLAVGAQFASTSATLGQTDERSPAYATPHFAFHSDFVINLNDALIEMGLARKNGKAELFHSGPEASCFEKLPNFTRAGWDRAVDFYAEVISPSEGPQFLIRMMLAGFGEELKNPADRQLVDVIRGLLAAAAPAYRACRWVAQDERNRRWIEELKPRLSVYEQKAAAQLTALYHKPWRGLPIPVDVVQTVNWSGANTILLDAGGGHILVSVSFEGPTAFEIVFHEATHTLMGHGDPLRSTLEDAAKAADFRLPRDLWHVVLFYVTGEAVSRIFEEGGEPPYKPVLEAIFERGTWSAYRSALAQTWRPYLNGQSSAAEAAADLIAALKKQEKSGQDPDPPKVPTKP